jgi:hypothetical protein
MTGDAIPQLVAPTFQPHIGTVFTVDDEAGMTVEIVLSSVEVPPDLDDDDVCFSLFFLGRPDEPLAQRIHRLDHAVIGAVELFLVPTGPVQDELSYEAVFNNPAMARELML